MGSHENINQYDLVEVIHVPEEYEGVIAIGDVGVVVEEYDGENFEVECIEPGGSCKWSAILNIKEIRLKSKDPFSSWAQKALADGSITKSSIKLGALLGAILGALIAAGLGALTGSLKGILIALIVGLLVGAVTGALTAALTVKTAGTTGGVAVGYFTGMFFGAVFGLLLGALVPPSLRMSAHTDGLPLLDALMLGRFETAMMASFFLSILATIVGVWIGGKNLAPRNLKERYRPR